MFSQESIGIRTLERFGGTELVVPPRNSAENSLVAAPAYLQLLYGSPWFYFPWSALRWAFQGGRFFFTFSAEF